MKNFLKKIVNMLVKIFTVFLIKFKVGRYFLFKVNKSIINQTKSIKKGDIKLSFFIPNEINFHRADTFFNKEPDTLNWIDNFKKNSVFYDIGANIGLYSCYAGKRKDCNIYSFEPSYFNLELLSKNIYLNNLSKKIKIIPIALSSENKVSEFNLSTIEWGGALSTFDKKFTYDGSKLDSTFNYLTISTTLDECLNYLKFPQPNYIKIDVDGIEHLILAASTKILQNTQSVLIEINENFLENKKQCESILKESGLQFVSKRLSML